jgi:hypothetical protein
MSGVESGTNLKALRRAHRNRQDHDQAQQRAVPSAFSGAFDINLRETGHPVNQRQLESFSSEQDIQRNRTQHNHGVANEVQALEQRCHSQRTELKGLDDKLRLIRSRLATERKEHEHQM